MSAVRPMRWDAVITAAIAAIAVAAIGGTLTDLGPWYMSLKEPSWKPPDAAFGPIWTVIFSFAVVSAVIAWQKETTTKGRQWIVSLFSINGLLNILWTFIFFQVRRPDLAMVEIGGLWLSILCLMVFLGRRSAIAGLLLAPYLIWVSIAFILNYQVVVLNGPFG